MNGHSEDLDALRQRVERDPGGVEFPAFADALRRAGDPEAALAVAERGLDHAGDNVAGRVARALALLALGSADDARGALEGVLEMAPGWLSDEAINANPLATDEPDARDGESQAIRDEELDAAFDGAETHADEMVSANDIAERAMEEVEGPTFAAVRQGTYATETMAGLLERQGDLDGAQAIRASIQRAPRGPGDSIERPYGALPLSLDAAEVPTSAVLDEPRDSSRASTLATLERWLANIHGGAR
jgi:hypothetical protein